MEVCIVSTHKGIRLRIRIPSGDIMVVSSLELHHLLRWGRYSDPAIKSDDDYSEVIKLVAGEYPDVEILAIPITEYEDDEPESNDCNS
jgi:hypothetical protein